MGVVVARSRARIAVGVMVMPGWVVAGVVLGGASWFAFRMSVYFAASLDLPDVTRALVILVRLSPVIAASTWLVLAWYGHRWLRHWMAGEHRSAR